MKKTDIATIILIATLSTLFAYFIGNSLFGDPNEESVTVEYMDPISTEVNEPDPEVFNPMAINPTVEVIIGEDRPTGEADDTETDENDTEDEADSGDDADTDEDNASAE